jgi:hypothetical protein
MSQRNRDYALVIGVDGYTEVGNNLQSAVDGAIKFCRWLLDDGVPADNIVLLLSRGPTSPTDGEIKNVLKPDVITYEQPEVDSIINKKGICKIMRRSKGAGDRLFLYFSGHGFSNCDYVQNDYLVGMDCIVGANPFPIVFNSVAAYFSKTDFNLQIFILDCCRDWKEFVQYPSVVGKCQTDVPHKDSNARVRQLFFWATASSMEANDFNGVYTNKLLEGLRGQGPTVRWDDYKQRYLVRPELLEDYLEAEFASNPNWHQTPRSFGDITRKTILTELPECSVKKVGLTLPIRAAVAIPRGKVTLKDDNGYEPFSPQEVSLPGTVVLPPVPPRRWHLIVEAHNYRTYDKEIELYGDLADANARPITLEPLLNIAARPQSAPAAAEEMYRLKHTAVIRQEARQEVKPPAGRSRLEVVSPDELTTITLSDRAGRLLIGAVKEAERSNVVLFEDIKPGMYEARVELPGVKATEGAIRLSPEQAYIVQIAPQPAEGSRLADEVRQAVRIAHHRRDDCDFCGTLAKAMVAARTPALLTIASDAAARGAGEEDHAHWLERLGLKGLPGGARCGLTVLLAADRGNRPTARHFAAQVRLRFWQLDGVPGPLAELSESSQISGLAEFSRVAQPGPYWLSAKLPDRNEVVYPVTLIDGFRTALVLHQESDAVVRIYQYVVSIDRDGPPTPALLRRLDQVENLLQNGQVSRAREIVDPLLAPGQRIDPMSGCFGAYLWATRERPEGHKELLDLITGTLKRISDHMVESYPTLSDCHVIRAAYETITGAEDARIRALYREALNCGLPNTSPWLARLAEGVQRLGIGPAEDKVRARAELLDRVEAHTLFGPLWTAWIPGAIQPHLPIEGA